MPTSDGRLPRWASMWTMCPAGGVLSAHMLAVGAGNLFDVFTNRNAPVTSFNGIQTFPSRPPFGMNGRTIYARIGRTF